MIGKLSASDKRELAKIQKSEKLIKEYSKESSTKIKTRVTLTDVRRSLMITGRLIKKFLPSKYEYYMKCSKAMFLGNKFGERKLLADLRYCYAYVRTRLLIKPSELNPDWV